MKKDMCLRSFVHVLLVFSLLFFVSTCIQPSTSRFRTASPFFSSKVQKVFLKSFTWAGSLTTKNCSSSCVLPSRRFEAFFCGTLSELQQKVVFMDPAAFHSPEYLLSHVNGTFWGSFECSEQTRSNLSLSFSLQSQLLDAQPISLPARDCTSCSKCLLPFSFSSLSRDRFGIRGYNYGGLNTFQLVLPKKHKICVSKVELVFHFVKAAPVLLSINPSYGPTTGNTVVSFTGIGLKSTMKVQCTFGTQLVLGTIASSPTELPVFFSCTSPPVSGPSTVVFMINVTDPETNETETAYPREMLYTYYEQPQLLSITPSNGTAGSNITLSGINLLATERVACRFGSKEILGKVTGEQTVNCTVPPGDGIVQVELSLNDQQFTSSNLNFTYVPDSGDDDDDSFLHQYIWAVILIAGVVGLTVILIVGWVVIKRIKQNNSSNQHTNQPSGYHRSEPISPLLSNDHGSETLSTRTFSPDDLSKIQLLEKIGRGTHGEVYKGLWRGTIVAVKKLPTHLLGDEFLEDFIREVDIMRSLRHPNVLQCLAACTISPDICIIMEYMSRGSLFRIIHDKKMRLDFGLIKRIMMDAARGMNYLHNSSPKILHRDFKSHNLLLDENWKCKVSDFGLSRILNESPMVATMTACGTPCWAAPEILRHHRYSEKADVYSYGVVLWECVTRQIPYQGMPPFQIVISVGTEGIRPPLPSNLSQPVSKLIQICWAENSELRPSFDDILLALEEIRDDDVILQSSSSSSNVSSSSTSHSTTTSPSRPSASVSSPPGSSSGERSLPLPLLPTSPPTHRDHRHGATPNGSTNDSDSVHSGMSATDDHFNSHNS